MQARRQASPDRWNDHVMPMKKGRPPDGLSSLIYGWRAQPPCIIKKQAAGVIKGLEQSFYLALLIEPDGLSGWYARQSRHCHDFTTNSDDEAGPG